MKLDVLINQIEQNYQNQLQTLIEEEEKNYNLYKIQLEDELNQFIKNYEVNLEEKNSDLIKSEKSKLKIKFDILINKKRRNLLDQIIIEEKSNFLLKLTNDKKLLKHYYLSIFNNPKINFQNVDSVSIDPIDFNFISNIIDLKSLKVIKEEKNKNVVFIDSNEKSRYSFGEEVSISVLRDEILVTLNNVIFGRDKD